jgi:hypothetical protein
MQITRRDFLKDLAYAAALVGLPSWVTQMDEIPPAEMMMGLSSGSNPWPWTPASDLGAGSSMVTVLNRIAFGPRPGDVEHVQQIGIDAYVEEQLAPQTIDDHILDARLAVSFPTLTKSIGELMQQYPQQPLQPARDLSKGEQLERLLAGLGIRTDLSNVPAEVVAELQDATLMRAIFSRRQLQEVLVDFWSTHFSIYAFKDEDRWMKTVDDRDVIRKNAFGKFGDLLLASASSPAMLVYLDNRMNIKGVPNENYAREVMELHTLGVDGGYTQADVTELARVLTGWTIRPARRNNQTGLIDNADVGTFVFDANRHDTGSKTVLGVNYSGSGGVEEGRQALDRLAHHAATATFIAHKLVTRFVSDAPPAALVQSAAQTFTQSDGDIRAVLSTILHSAEFKNSFAQKIKRPFELVASAARAVDLQAQDIRILSTTLRLMGQGLFMRFTPDGYPDNGAAWVNTSALLARWNFSMLLAGGKVTQATVDLNTPMQAQLPKTIPSVVDFWVDRLLHRPIPDTDRQKLIDALGGASSTFTPTGLPYLVALILASPHFQYR